MSIFRTYSLAALSVVALHVSSPAVCAQSQTPLNILFLGDSFTDYVAADNHVPAEVAAEAQSAGFATPNVSFNAPGGYCLDDHLNDSNSLGLIAQGGWNYVVVQEQSARPALEASIASDDDYEFEQMYSLMKASSPNATLVLYDTWAYPQSYLNSIIAQGNTYEGSTTAEMQSLTDQTYLQGYDDLISIGDTNVLLATVGDAWQLNYSENNQNLFWDSTHPNAAGSYLSSLVLFETMYNTSPVGLQYAGLQGLGNPAYLQSLAVQVMPVPEPSTGMLVLSGALALVAMVRMRRSGFLAKS